MRTAPLVPFAASVLTVPTTVASDAGRVSDAARRVIGERILDIAHLSVITRR